MVERALKPRPGLPTEEVDLLERLFRARGAGEEQRSLGLADLLPPTELPNIAAAVERLSAAIVQGQRILLVGDFDADGATSVALAVSTLRAFGAQQLDYVVPNRFEYGYGLSPEIIDLASTF